MGILQTREIALGRVGSPELSFPDLSIEQGQTTLLLGPSGCGKTSLLSIIAGFTPPTRGNVLFKDADLYAMPSAKRDLLRGRNFGFVFQTLHLLPALTLRQNIELAASMADVKVEEGRIDSLLAKLGLADKANRRPSSLSQGEQQRAAVARAVLNRPSILLADEPTSALDDRNAQIVADLLIAEARDAGAALLMATHDHRIMNIFDKVIHLNSSYSEAA